MDFYLKPKLWIFMFKVFRVATQKMGEKFEFRSVEDIFKCTQVSNEVSNEKVPKTKVVDLEILSKFGIQKFFV